jgi:elongation factor P
MIAKEIKPGTLLVYNEAPCMVKSVFAQSPSARGASMIYKYKCVNLLTKQKVDIALRGGESLPEANFEKRAVQFLYSDPTSLHFMDLVDYNQYELPLDSVEDEAQYLTERLEGVQALIYNDQCVGVSLPAAVELKVTQCDPSARGNSANARTKPATLETGLVVQVPEYLKEGEMVKVDTRSGEFLSRA